MTAAHLPANLIFLRPRGDVPQAVRAPQALPPVTSRAQLLARLETIGSLAPTAPLSFLIVTPIGVDDRARDAAFRAMAERTRELIRPMDCAGRFGDGSLGIVLQGTGSTAASAVAARLAFHLDHVLAAHTPGAQARVAASTGVGANAAILPIAASDSEDDCC